MVPFEPHPSNFCVKLLIQEFNLTLISRILADDLIFHSSSYARKKGIASGGKGTLTFIGYSSINVLLSSPLSCFPLVGRVKIKGIGRAFTLESLVYSVFPCSLIQFRMSEHSRIPSSSSSVHSFL